MLTVGNRLCLITMRSIYKKNSADVQLEVALPGDLLSVNMVQKAIDM
jgi:hypothetical protein